FPPEWVHDEWLAIVAASVGGVSLVREPLIDYRQHGANAIGARKLGLREKAGRLAEPRAQRNARLLASAKVFADRVLEPEEAVSDRRRAAGGGAGLTHPDGIAHAVQLAAGRLAHERMRSALPAGRLRRLPRVLGAAIAGRYHRYGRGAMDV